ncbi:hypothetical protein AeMF1_004917 [Aphanomyces euteiches]|nr:hypothetical protein AeMF1_004917 [Aphanomyces euteiches]KAH9185797.1 hypothetical protein AeNC1_012229 [Aphanomyces euteiches]
MTTMEKPYGRIPLWQLTPATLSKWRSVYEKQEESIPVPTTNEEVPVAAPMVNAETRGLTCGTCHLEFGDVDSQKVHFKTDFHVYNIKRKTKGLDCVSESEYNTFIATASKVTEEKDEDEAPHPLDLSTSSDEDEDSDEDDKLSPKEPLQAYTDDKKVFKVYNAVFADWSDKVRGSWNASTEMVETLVQSSSFQWAVLLFRAGRFAGAVFRKDKVLVHKTFQRYTTRRKQGGSQSAHDNASGKARSAGAQLRRYNEMALQQDIVDVLQTWASELRDCERIFIGCAKTSRGIFFEKSTGLASNDPRVRHVPFGTLRPTYDEVCRVRGVLGSVHYSPYRAADFAKPQPLPSPPSKKVAVPAPAVPEASPTVVEGTIEAPVVEELKPALPPPPVIQAVEEQDVAALEALLSESLDVNTIHTDGSLRTALHVASQLNFAAGVQWLLDHGADPCVVDDRGRVPYLLATVKEVRNVYRRFRGGAPDKWDYIAAKIPEALTDELEEAQKQKAKDKKKRAAERKKEAKQAEARERLVEEAKQAEAAARRAKETACAFCGQPSGAKPFSRLTYLYCSTECVNNHKRQLMAEAAMKRFGQA